MKGIKIILWISSIGSLFGFVYAVLPWPLITGWISTTGLEPPGNEGATIYMFRLGFMSYGMMGVFFGILAKNPFEYGVMLPLAACYMMLYALFRLAGGIIYGYPVWHYIGDFIAGTVFGVTILLLRKKVTETHGA